MKIKYGSATFDIHPAFSPTVNFEHLKDEDEAATIKEVWDIEGSFKDDGWSALITSWNGLVADLRKPAQDFSVVTDADVTVYSLAAADCISGPSCTEVTVTEKRQAFLVTNIRFKMRIEAEYRNPEATETDGQITTELELSYRFDALGYLTISERGKTESVAAIQNPPDPFLNLNKDAYEQTSDFRLSKDQKECSYSYTFKERMAALPSSLKDLVTDFSFEISERTAEDFFYDEISVRGRVKLKRKNTAQEIWNKRGVLNQSVNEPRDKIQDYTPVEGIDDIANPGVEAVVEWIKNDLVGNGVQLTDRDISVDPTEQSVSFSLSLLLPRADVARFDYSISMRGPTVDTSVVKVYGERPVVQRQGYSAVEISERGSITMIGTRPDLATPVWPERCTERSVSWPKPSYDIDEKLTFASMEFSFTYIDDFFSASDLLTVMNRRRSWENLPFLDR